jgi:hypothetical protein
MSLSASSTTRSASARTLAAGAPNANGFCATDPHAGGSARGSSGGGFGNPTSARALLAGFPTPAHAELGTPRVSSPWRL